MSPKEQLSQLCWNGMLFELIPEITLKDSNGKKSRIWDINETGHLLDIRLGEINEIMDDTSSINPFFILKHANLN